MERFIALMGYGHGVSESNLVMAREAGVLLVGKGFGVAAGNLTGTFSAGLLAAREADGKTFAVVDESMRDLDQSFCDELIEVEKDKKHEEIAGRVVGGLILGGGAGTIALASKIAALGKPLVAVSGTGGAVDDGTLGDTVSYVDTVSQGVELLDKR